jgi:hypothetical protein
MGVRKKAKAFLSANHPRTYSTVVRMREAVVGSAWKLWLLGKSPSNVFSTMYAKKLWGGNESRSGGGSGLEQTKQIREQLPSLVNQLNIKKILDAPCGDFHWMKEVELEVDEYIGADIVDEVVADNAKKYADQARRFVVLDIMNDTLPAADLILCRDCLVHLSFRDASNVIHNFKQSKSRYLLTTTFTEQGGNTNIQTGEWRPLNLQKAPFNFPEPIKLIREDRVPENGFDKCLGLWRIADLP